MSSIHALYAASWATTDTCFRAWGEGAELKAMGVRIGVM